MNKQIEALKMAIEAVEGQAFGKYRQEVVAKLKEALAEAEKQEPVAWMMLNEHNKQICITETNLRSTLQGDYVRNLWKDAQPLYTHPAPSWQSLSDDEKWNLINNSDIPADYDHEVLAIAHAIDAKLKEKNQ